MHEVIPKGILFAKNGMNIYRGCSHGCIYCDSRSLCYQMNHSFEDIEVKKNAPELLEMSLRKKRKKGMIATGAMSDPYIPLELELENTCKCLEIIERLGLTLREENREYFYQQLDKHFLGLKEKYIRNYGNSYEVMSKSSGYLMNLIKVTCEQNNVLFGVEKIFNYLKLFEEKQYEQMRFDL